MKTYCTYCSQEYEIEKELIGKDAQCVVCNNVFNAECQIICPVCSKIVLEKACICSGCGAELKNGTLQGQFYSFFLEQQKNNKSFTTNQNLLSKYAYKEIPKLAVSIAIIGVIGIIVAISLI